MLKQFMLLLCFALACVAAEARIYKWVDEEGNVHFSEKPPPDQKQQVEQIKGGSDSIGGAGNNPQIKKYCGEVQKFAYEVARAMAQGVDSRTISASTAKIDQELQDVLGATAPYLKQVIHFVYGFKNSDSDSGKIAQLAYNQCLNGAYGAKKLAEHAAKGATGGNKSGTGWPVAQGYIITNAHVVAGANQISVVLANGVKTTATIAEIYRKHDIALLAVTDEEFSLNALPLAIGGSQLGDQVFTIGYPHPDIMGSKPKLTTGSISAVAGLRDNPDFYQISVPLQGGNSGGPLISMNGEVVGIVTAKINAVSVYQSTGDLPENVNYAIKHSVLQQLLDGAPTQRTNWSDVPAAPGSVAEIVARLQDSVVMIITH